MEDKGLRGQQDSKYCQIINCIIGQCFSLKFQPGPLFSDIHQHCQCDHLTAFSGFIVPPNKLDINDQSVTFAT